MHIDLIRPHWLESDILISMIDIMVAESMQAQTVIGEDGVGCHAFHSGFLISETKWLISTQSRCNEKAGCPAQNGNALHSKSTGRMRY